MYIRLQVLHMTKSITPQFIFLQLVWLLDTNNLAKSFTKLSTVFSLLRSAVSCQDMTVIARIVPSYYLWYHTQTQFWRPGGAISLLRPYFLCCLIYVSSKTCLWSLLQISIFRCWLMKAARLETLSRQWPGIVQSSPRYVGNPSNLSLK